MPRLRTETNTYQIDSDGISVWVNDATGLIGRFGNAGIDIHRTREEQRSSGVECLHCTHAWTTRADWDVFVEKMKEIYNVVVPKKHIPLRLKTP